MAVSHFRLQILDKFVAMNKSVGSHELLMIYLDLLSSHCRLSTNSTLSILSLTIFHAAAFCCNKFMTFENYISCTVVSCSCFLWWSTFFLSYFVFGVGINGEKCFFVILLGYVSRKETFLKIFYICSKFLLMLENICCLVQKVHGHQIVHEIWCDLFSRRRWGA